MYEEKLSMDGSTTTISNKTNKIRNDWGYCENLKHINIPRSILHKCKWVAGWARSVREADKGK